VSWLRRLLGRRDASTLQVPARIETAPPEAGRALEAAWQRRRTELGSWQPSNGWLVDQPKPRKHANVAELRIERAKRGKR
jgi:hypothetical protein